MFSKLWGDPKCILDSHLSLQMPPYDKPACFNYFYYRGTIRSGKEKMVKISPLQRDNKKWDGKDGLDLTFTEGQ